VAGEIDALSGLQMDLPAVTTTCGATVPQHLAALFTRCSVYVLFDVGELRAAKAAARQLLASGARSAQVLDLGHLGLPRGGDLNDLHRQGGTREDIVALVRLAQGPA
jgi:hypothetical protein